MNVFKKELRNYFFSTVLWTSILVIVLIFYLAIYPIYYDSKDAFLEMINKFPEEVLIAFNINVDTMFSPLGYYCFLFTYVLILGAFQAAILGLKIMVNDTIENANGFMLTKPMTRKKILTSRLIAAIACLIITNICFQLISFIMMNIIKNEEGVIWHELLLINLALLLIQLTFLSIAMMIGGFLKKPKTVTIVAVISIIAFYIISVVQEITNVEFIRYLNPFSYFKVEDVLESSGYKPSFIIASIFITFFCVSFAYNHYDNSDCLGGK